MNRPDRIKVRKWRALSWRDPKSDLISLGKIQSQLARSTGVSPTVMDLRTRKLRKYLEWRQAALFAYFVSAAITKEPIAYVLEEDEDYDAVICRKDGNKTLCTPVQLQEIVPKSLDPQAELNAELLKLEKYPTSSDTVVAVHLNQSNRLEYSAIAAPKTSCKEICIYGALSANQYHWLLFGDILNNPAAYEVDYPT